MERNNVKLIRSLPRHPTTGGRFERFHQTLKMKLAATLLEQPGTPLELAVDYALFAYK